MIVSNQLTQEQSYNLGIAILVGYIFGSLVIDSLKSFLSLETIAKISFVLVAGSFFACMIDLPFFWAWTWRFIAGVASSGLMILAAPLSLPLISDKHKGKVGGLVFSGIGLGAIVGGLILPRIANYSANVAWASLGGIVTLAFIFSLFYLPPLNPPKKSKISKNKFKTTSYLWLLIISYSLNAIGYLPHTLFWTDYLTRGLGFSSVATGASWAFFGIGAAFGSFFSGTLGDRIGVKNAHFIILGLKTFSCFIAISTSDLFWLNLSVFLMGFGTTGNVTLTNAMALQIYGREDFATAVSRLTFAFGIFQAIFSYTFAYWLGYSNKYFWLFILCAVITFVSLLLLIPIKRKINMN